VRLGRWEQALKTMIMKDYFTQIYGYILTEPSETFGGFRYPEQLFYVLSIQLLAAVAQSV
jgi:hypothetical protein